MPSTQQSGSSNSNNGSGQSPTAYVGDKKFSGEQRYTAEEKAYIKEQFGGEYKMLRDNGLSIYKESDREEGRAIARAFMEQDKNSSGN